MNMICNRLTYKAARFIFSKVGSSGISGNGPGGPVSIIILLSVVVLRLGIVLVLVRGSSVSSNGS